MLSLRQVCAGTVVEVGGVKRGFGEECKYDICSAVHGLPDEARQTRKPAVTALREKLLCIQIPKLSRICHKCYDAKRYSP